MSDQGPGSNTKMEIYKGFFQSSAAAFAGGAACYLNFRSMRTIMQHRMASGPAAITFVVLFGAINSQGYKYARRQIKGNFKTARDEYNKM